MTSSLLDPTTRPDLADSYFDWGAAEASAPIAGPGGTVAVAATSSWGPINESVEITDTAQIAPTFGDGPLARAISDAMIGHGFDGLGGAGKVIATRQAVVSGGSTAVKGVRTLNLASTGLGITLTARSFGTRFNALRWTVQTSPFGGKELLVIDGSYVRENYQIPSGDLTALAAEINVKSKFHTCVAATPTGTLADVSSLSPSTPGADGASLTGTEWDTTFDVLDRVGWDYFAPYGLTDGTIRAALKTWIRERNAIGMRGTAITGGAAGEVLATGITRSQGLNDFNMLNLGFGSIVRTDEPGSPTRSTAEFVARYAGARAFRGERANDIVMRFAGAEIVGTNGASRAEQSQAKAGGLIVFERDARDSSGAPVFVREGVTSYTDDSASPMLAGNKQFPVSMYRDVRGVAIQSGIEREVNAVALNGHTLGWIPNDKKGRQRVLGFVRDVYERREIARIVQPGWTVTDYMPNNDNDWVAYLHGFKPTRSLRQLFNIARVG